MMPHKNIDKMIFAILTAIIMIACLINIDLSGIYFDAVITDYLAALVVHPQVGNAETTMSHVGLPLL